MHGLHSIAMVPLYSTSGLDNQLLLLPALNSQPYTLNYPQVPDGSPRYLQAHEHFS